MAHRQPDEVPPRDREASPAVLILEGQELDADVEDSSGVDPHEFHSATRPASRCGHVHGGLREHRPRCIHDLEAVVLGAEIGQVGWAEYR
jgi:hypothetical protein